MRFTKMHGLGNDYVYVNCFDQDAPEPSRTAVAVSDRHFGVGSDGLILIMPTAKADVRMRMFNADGSESEMCGNGVRCLAKYSYDHGLATGANLTDKAISQLLQAVIADADEFRQLQVETGNGILTLGLAIVGDKVEQVCVNMGRPILSPIDVPVKVTGQQAVGVPLKIDGSDLLMTCISMGNPHAVFYCEDVQAVDLEKIGPLIENHEMFPQRVNVHFVQTVSENEVIMRTWERGSGITLACGTGASAVCVAGVLASKSADQILAHLPGGDLQLKWDQKKDRVYMIGPATEVFTGQWQK